MHNKIKLSSSYSLFPKSHYSFSPSTLPLINRMDPSKMAGKKRDYYSLKSTTKLTLLTHTFLASVIEDPSRTEIPLTNKHGGRSLRTKDSGKITKSNSTEASTSTIKPTRTSDPPRHPFSFHGPSFFRSQMFHRNTFKLRTLNKELRPLIIYLNISKTPFFSPWQKPTCLVRGALDTLPLDWER